MAKLKEALDIHLAKHGLKKGDHASERHEYAHLLLDLNGFTQSNITFRSEEQQIVTQLALFGELSHAWGDNITSVKVSNLLPKEEEKEQIFKAVKLCRKQMLLPLFRHLTLLEVYRDDFVKKHPDNTNYTDEQIELQAKEVNKDFLQHKIDVLSNLRNEHLNISLKSFAKAVLTFMTEYDGKLNKHDVSEVFDIANSIRKNFYIKHRTNISDVPIEKLREMDTSEFVANKEKQITFK